MLKNVWIITDQERYDTKQYFSEKFAEALKLQGIRVEIIPFQTLPQKLQQARPDLLFSFFRLYGSDLSDHFWERLQIPFWFALLNPARGRSEMFSLSRYTLLSCVDEFDCEYVRSRGLDKVFFWGHAVDKNLHFDEAEKRPLDFLYAGTFYDPQAIEQLWEQHSPKERQAIQESIELYQHDESVTEVQAVESAMQRFGLSPKAKNLFIKYLDNYCRGIDRIHLIKAASQVGIVSIYGDATNWPPGIRGWDKYFANNKNIIVHRSIPFGEVLQLMKRSKISLNSMPFFKSGTHERIFSAAACGSLNVTTENLWLKRHFRDGEDVLFYRMGHWTNLIDKMDYYLTHEEERKALSASCRAKVMANHTWDHRVDEFMQVWKRLG